MHQDVRKYNAAQKDDARTICEAFAEGIDAGLKGAELRITNAAQVTARDLKRWLRKAETIQWDYKNILKRRGVLEKLGDW
jgi:hypothetical protein